MFQRLFQGNISLALLFITVGAIPLYGITLIFAAVVLRVKEASALVNLMQWLISFLMGVFFPLALLPAFLRNIALLFPPTWMTNGARASLLGVGYFLKEWYFDLSVLWGFVFLAPLIGYNPALENHLQTHQHTFCILHLEIVLYKQLWYLF